MQPGHLEVDVELVRSAASSVADTAEKVRSGVTAAGPGLAPPPQPGSDAAAAARTAEQVWLAELGRLQRDLGAFAEHLAGAATGYRTTDEAGADGLRRAGRGAWR